MTNYTSVAHGLCLVFFGEYFFLGPKCHEVMVGNNVKHTVEFKTNKFTHFHGLTSSDDVESSERGY